MPLINADDLPISSSCLSRLVKSIENDNKKIYEKIKDFQNISCVDLPGLEDEIFLSAVLNNEEDNYNSFLIQLCESFDIFSLRKQSLKTNQSSLQKQESY